MKLAAISLIIIILISVSTYSQTAAKKIQVIPLSVPSNSANIVVTGDIKNGKVLSSLRWAEQSNVACFPATRFEMFSGNHIFYRIVLPSASVLSIKVTPRNNATINLYALRQGTNSTDQTVPPDIKSAISCEASYPIYANLPGGGIVTNEDDGIRKIEYISIGRSYSILIGIAGARDLREGEFELMVEIKRR